MPDRTSTVRLDPSVGLPAGYAGSTPIGQRYVLFYVGAVRSRSLFLAVVVNNGPGSITLAYGRTLLDAFGRHSPRTLTPRTWCGPVPRSREHGAWFPGSPGRDRCTTRDLRLTPFGRSIVWLGARTDPHRDSERAIP
jgi:hypothetical protein